MEVASLQFRTSPYTLVVKAVALTIPLYAASLLVSLVNANDAESNIYAFLLSKFGMLSLSFFAEAVLLSVLFWQWLSRTYEIRDVEIVRRKGIFLRTIKSHSLRGVQSVTVRQGVLGALFSFGNIILENPLLKREVVLRHIPDPEYYASVLREAIKNIDTPKAVVTPRK